jgi:hypothetical protein
VVTQKTSKREPGKVQKSSQRIRTFSEAQQDKVKPPEKSCTHSFIQVDTRDHGNLEFLPCIMFSIDFCRDVRIGLALAFVVHITCGIIDLVMCIPLQSTPSIAMF